MDTDEIFKLLSKPLAIQILKTIWCREGVGFDELITDFKKSQTDLYSVLLSLIESGLIFYSLKKYELNPLGRGIMEAINIIEDAVQGKDIVVFDISGPEGEKVIKYIDNIIQN